MRCHDGALGLKADDRVAQRHDKGLAADKGFGAADRVAQPQQLTLAGKEIAGRRPLEHQLGQQLLLARLAQRLDQLGAQVEVIFDRHLARPRHKEDAIEPDRVSSSTTYWTTGLRPTGSISLGWDLVAGSRRVPKPATGTTAIVTVIFPSIQLNCV